MFPSFCSRLFKGVLSFLCKAFVKAFLRESYPFLKAFLRGSHRFSSRLFLKETDRVILFCLGKMIYREDRE